MKFFKVMIITEITVLAVFILVSACTLAELAKYGVCNKALFYSSVAVVYVVSVISLVGVWVHKRKIKKE